MNLNRARQLDTDVPRFPERTSWRSRLSQADAIAPVALACSWAALMWALPHSVSMDSPSHMYTARLAMEMLFKSNSPFNQFYELNSAFLPDWGTTLLLGFLNLLIPGGAAEQMLKACLPILFGAAVWRLLRGRSGHPLLVVALFYPLIFSFFLSAGFYGFYIATALMLVVLHFVLPHPRTLSPGKACFVGLLLVAAYYFHVFPFALAVIFSVCSIVIDTVLDLGKSLAAARSRRKVVGIRHVCSVIAKSFGWEARRLWLAMLPALFLAAMHLHYGASNAGGIPLSSSGEMLARLAGTLVFVGPIEMISWNPALRVFTIVFVFGVFIFALGKKSVFRERALSGEELKLGLCAACALVLFLVVPNSVGDASLISARFIYVALLLMVFFGARHFTRKESWVCFLLMIVPFAYTQQRSVYRDAQTLKPYAEEIQQVASHVKPGATILALAYDTTSRKFEAYAFEQAPLRNLPAYLAIKSHAVWLNNYEGITDFFPVKFRSEVRSPELRALVGEFLPNKLPALRSFISRHQELVDYAIVWETDHGSVPGADKQAVQDLLGANFRLIYQNPTPAMLYVYARPSLVS